MSSIALKFIATTGALFGLLIVLLSVALLSQGQFSSLSNGTIALKITFTVARVACLVLCAWAAWRAPHLAAWFAWGACAAFAIGAAADQVYVRGLSGGFGNLISSYYWAVAVHAVFAISIWLLAAKTSANPVDG